MKKKRKQKEREKGRIYGGPKESERKLKVDRGGPTTCAREDVEGEAGETKESATGLSAGGTP